MTTGRCLDAMVSRHCSCCRRSPSLRRRLSPRPRIAGRSSAARPLSPARPTPGCPPSLKLLWTYEAGDAIESSAAIADSVVYVGSQTGELHAVNLTDGKPRWKYKASADGIGESSPAIAGGLVYVGDLSGVLHAVHADSGKVAWTFKTGIRDQVVAGRRRRQSDRRIVRLAPVRPRRERREAPVEGPH